MMKGHAPQDLAAAACRVGLAARPAPTLEEALRQAARLRPDSPVRIVIAGSLHLAGQALAKNEGEET
jgi:folylpolyglutamate synthase/dihydropteroate synthase